MTSLRVWWTISGSDVAWEWWPGDATVRAGRLIRSEGGELRFTGSEEWTPMWSSAETRAGFQAFKDLTALFAEEANVVPGEVRIFWLVGERAVSWCRSTGTLRRYSSGTGTIALPGEALAEEERELRAADTLARAALGI